jgi:hypothetical protein
MELFAKCLLLIFSLICFGCAMLGGLYAMLGDSTNQQVLGGLASLVFLVLANDAFRALQE